MANPDMPTVIEFKCPNGDYLEIGENPDGTVVCVSIKGRSVYLRPSDLRRLLVRMSKFKSAKAGR